MQSQTDWIGGGKQSKDGRPFKDIRSTRPTVAEEKAAKCMELGQLLKRAPASVVNGSVNLTREWQAARAAASKVAGSSRSSVQGGRQLAQQRPRAVGSDQLDAAV